MNYHEFEFNYDTKSSLKCLVYTPYNYDLKEKLPLIISLHGSGERGKDLNLLKRYGIHKVLKDNNRFPFIVVSPQCPENEIWEMQFKILDSLIEFIQEKYKVDNHKLYLTGYSLGGYGTWNYGILNPDLFAAIIPISGGVMALQKSIALRNIPIWTAHGNLDTAVDISETMRVVNYLKDYNNKIEFKVYENAGHEICTKAYEEEDLYKWMLRQSK